MPGLRTYSLFICHDWEYADDYQRICDFLDGAPNFSWNNLSVPEHDPLDTDDMLQKNLRDQIRPADVMLVMAGTVNPQLISLGLERPFVPPVWKPVIPC